MLVSVAEAFAAEQNGATRIELCEDIEADGVTPNDQLIQSCLTNLNIPIKILIRPRAGNFVYNKNEIETMLRSISRCKVIGVQEVVIGALLPNSELDIPLITKMASLASPMKVSIHKAIDSTNDPVAATQQLSKVDHVTGILTSGGHSTAIEGAYTIRKMIAAGKGKLEITAAGKILASNVETHHQLINAPAYHGRRIVPLK